MGKKRKVFEHVKFPNILRQTREALGKTPVEAAAALRVTVAMIFRYESGMVGPSALRVPYMEEFYGKKLYDLYPELFIGVQEE